LPMMRAVLYMDRYFCRLRQGEIPEYSRLLARHATAPGRPRTRQEHRIEKRGQDNRARCRDQCR